MIASRDGMQMMFSLSHDFLMMVSVQRGSGGFMKTPSGALETFSFVPKTPMKDSTLS